MRHRLIRLRGVSAFENLAMEECLFAHLPPSTRRLIFYAHRPAIVLGRTQNPFYEASVPHAQKTGTPILRRRSGGGTVVHDMYNVNVSFMGPTAVHDPPRNVDIMMRGLAMPAVGVPHNALGTGKRGDITIRGKKISGSAYRLSKGSAYHHATLLVDSDLNALRACLASEIRGGLVASGAESVRSSVTNIADEVASGAGLRRLDDGVDDVIQAVAKSYCGAEGVSDFRVEEMGVEDVEREIGSGIVREEARALERHDWVYGQTPRFSYSLEYPDGSDGNSRVVVFIKKGAVVESVQVLSGAQNSATTVGAARGRGSLGGDDGHLDHTKLTELLSGTVFCGQELQRRAEAAESPELRGIVSRIAASIPKEQYVSCPEESRPVENFS